MDIVRLSENSMIVLFEQSISHDNFLIISKTVRVVKEQLHHLMIDIVPSYASIHITFDILKISGVEFTAALKKAIADSALITPRHCGEKVIEIPIYYGDEVALDLSYLAERASITKQDVIDIHSSRVYNVYAMGFAPGFAYLGNVDDRIACPRKETPRKEIAKGSLGIADQQTGIYPTASPGGWQILGRTPIQLIDYSSEQLTPFSTGDKVKFNPMTRSEYLAMGGTF